MSTESHHLCEKWTQILQGDAQSTAGNVDKLVPQSYALVLLHASCRFWYALISHSQSMLHFCLPFDSCYKSGLLALYSSVVQVFLEGISEDQELS